MMDKERATPQIDDLAEKLQRAAATRRRFLGQAGAAGVAAAALYAAPKITSVKAVEQQVLTPTPTPPNGLPPCDPAVNLIVNGSFENGINVPGGGFDTLYDGSPNMTGWSIDSGSIDRVHSGYWQSSNGNISLDMDGASPGAISQVIPTVAGQMYRVSFDMAGNTAGAPGIKTMDVVAIEMVALSLVGSYSASFDTAGKSYTNMGWEAKSFDFMASSASTKIKFSSTTNGTYYGPALDNVRVNCLTPAG
jgi:choice-of-anchor C domain-containing protein